jgi:hypothetical protein
VAPREQPIGGGGDDRDKHSDIIFLCTIHSMELHTGKHIKKVLLISQTQWLMLIISASQKV